jgi:tRNA pseudouridine13 synthase
MISERRLYKLRSRDEDFVVEELIDLPQVEDGRYALFRMTKRKLTTLEALKILARRKRVPLSRISYAGLKDKHGIAVQHLSSPREYDLSIEERNFRVEFLYYIDERLRLGMHLGNRFTITLRKVRRPAYRKFLANVPRFQEAEIPNYYDSQRFGSLRGAQRFLAEEVMRGNYEEALKLHLTSAYRKQKSYIKRIKRFIAEHWGDWTKCRKFLEQERRYENFLEIIAFLEKSEDFVGALRLIPEQLRMLYAASYQSFLWNEALKHMLLSALGKEALEEVEYLAGSLYFPKGEHVHVLREALPKPKLEMPCPESKERIYRVLLRERGLRLKDMRRLEKLGMPIARNERSLLFSAGELCIKEKGVDGNYPWLTLSFWLPPGSYATIVLKALVSA